MTNRTRQLIIIGSGPAGYTAALYAARANLRPLVYTGYQSGGQLMLTTEIENYPGGPAGVMGPALMAQMRAQAERFGAELRERDVTAVDLTHRPFTVHADEETERAAALIVATGAAAQWLGIPGEEEYRGRGVSSCATCDGYFFRDKRVVVVGGGDVAMEEAVFLSRLAREVTVVHRRDHLRASKAMQDRVLASSTIRVVWDTVVSEVLGDRDDAGGAGRVTGLRTRNVQTGAVGILQADALFVAIGHLPNTAMVRDQIPLDERGYALTLENESTATAVAGVFAAGDVRDHRYRQAITAAADGCKAAMDAERWLDEQGTVDADHTHEVSAGTLPAVAGAPH
ncbi:MAG: thioredoxin-disulfide reductase [Chloroflexota bacterium]